MKTNIIFTIAITFFTSAILMLSLRGISGNPTTQNLNDSVWKDEGPFELSPERGRFSLMFSLLENNSYQFSLPIAQFASPDVAYTNGQFVSLFAPALSFIIMPGYLIGKMFDLGQVGTFASISFFAILNLLFIKKIGEKLGAHPIAATFAGLIFLFATPAFAYAVSLYQHHVSTFFILSSIYVLIRWKNTLSLVYVWFACAFSVALDNPNLFIMAPIGMYALTRFFSIQHTKQAVLLIFKPLGMLTLLAMAIPITFFMYVNFHSYGNPFQLAGTVDVEYNISLNQLLGLPPDVADESLQREQNENLSSNEQSQQTRSPLRFFRTRNLLNGLHTHLTSVDRGIITYTPIILLGIIGLFLLRNTFVQYHRLFIAILGVILLLYSMWGDPYGGWAFGSRYMIPAYGILSVGLAIAITRYRHSLLFILLMLLLSGYSIFVNTIGAVTTSRIPPKVQVLSLEELSGKEEKYTFTRGMQMLDDNRSKSFVFQSIGNQYLTAWQYAFVLMLLVICVTWSHLGYVFITDRKSFQVKKKPRRKK